MEPIDQNDISNLIDKLNNLKQKDIQEIALDKIPAVKDITPEEVERIVDPFEREKKKKEIETMNYLYVVPLENLLKYKLSVLGKTQDYDIQHLSISKKIQKLTSILVKLGYTIEYITDCFPKLEYEVKMLLDAKEKGFVDDKPVDNLTRVYNAIEFLMNNNKKK